MNTKTCSMFLMLMVSVLAHAEAPHVFTDGQPAVAAELNANFNAAFKRMEQLEAQLAALQPQAATVSILGTWDFVMVDIMTNKQSNTDYNFSQAASKGYLTFSAGSVVSGSATTVGQYVNLHNNYNATPPGGASIISATMNNENQTDAVSGTYSLSGNVVTISVNGTTFNGFMSKDGKTIICTMNGGSDPTGGIMVATKR